MSSIPMELSRIIISEINDRQVIDLKEIGGERQFPILIGIFEATMIERRVKRCEWPRPLTHDLVVNIAETLGAQLECVEITELIEGTYFAHLQLKRDGEVIDIDARPSDAIAIAVTCQPHLPIYVAEQVLDEVLNQ